jgi:hypothetical protein
MTKDKEEYICVHSLQIIRLVLSQVFCMVKAKYWIITSTFEGLYNAGVFSLSFISKYKTSLVAIQRICLMPV